MHHVGFSDQETEVELNSLHIGFKGAIRPWGASLGGTFEIAETDPAWPVISRLILARSFLDIAYTLFDKEEVLETPWVRLTPTSEQGYPQPRRSWELTTLAGGCSRCGVGAVQIAPYRIAQEPKMTRFDFMSLYWTYVMFATPRVLRVFSERSFGGYEQWPVILHRTGRPAESVTQVYIPSETKPGLLDAHKLGRWVCPDCKQVLWDPVRRGPIRYSRDAFPVEGDFARSNEWFGGTGHQEIFVSHPVARMIIENRWKGAKLEPIDLV